ncbi:MAG: hypothetical protein U1F43_27345 [Myxococcota bacterium]
MRDTRRSLLACFSCAALVFSAGSAAAATLKATMTASGPLLEGSTVLYTISVTNTGTSPQPNNPGHEVSGQLPQTLTLGSATATSGTTVAFVAGNEYSWNGYLPIGDTLTITVTATIHAGTVGQTISAQTVLSYDVDDNGTNETVTLSDDPALPGDADATAFVVVAPSDCGDGQVTGNEECDDGRQDDGDCCLANCTAAPDDTPCDDDTLCDGREVCAAGLCVAGAEPDCDDGDLCTFDACDPSLGCIHEGDCPAEPQVEVVESVEVVEVVEVVEEVEPGGDTTGAEPEADSGPSAEADPGAEVAAEVAPVGTSSSDGCRGADGVDGLGLALALAALLRARQAALDDSARNVPPDA